LEQIDRGRAEQEEAARCQPPAPPPINETAQALKQLRGPVDLVQDHQFVLVARQVALGVGEPGAIRFRLEIEID
jgi:hypothetical protein